MVWRFAQIKDCWGYVTLGEIPKDARGRMTKGFFSNRIAKVTTDATTSKGGTQPIQPVNIIGSSLRQCVKSRNPGDSWPLDPTDPTCVQTSQPCQFFVKSSRSGAVIAPPCRAISGKKKESAWVHHSRTGCMKATRLLWLYRIVSATKENRRWGEPCFRTIFTSAW